MIHEDHYRKLERAYRDARCNEYYAPALQISEGEARVTIELQPKMHHAANAAHGSVYFKALDDAAFFAANSLVEEVFLLTVSFTLYLMRPAVDGRLEARGYVTHRTGRLFFAEAALFDQGGEQIARGGGTFAKSGIRLTPEIGYR